ncbi:hypothetical protein LCGC14_2471060, partial [marine sediment metagenome]
MDSAVPTTVAGIEILDHGANDPTNSFAIRIVSQSTGGTTNQSLRVEGSADSVHEPNLRIGSTTAPTVELDVTGAISASGLITGTLGLTISGADFSLDADLDFVGPQSITTSTGDLTLNPADDVLISGDLDVSQHVAAGSSASIDSEAIIHTNETILLSTSAAYGIRVNVNAQVENNSFSNLVWGGFFDVTVTPNEISASKTTVLGFEGRINLTLGASPNEDVGTAIGFRGQIRNVGSATGPKVTNAYGVQILGLNLGALVWTWTGAGYIILALTLAV